MAENVGRSPYGGRNVFLDLPFRKIEQSVALASFTDNGDDSGYIDLTTQLPARALVFGWVGNVTTAFDGTTPTLEVGVAADTDEYTTTPADVSSTGYVAGAGTPAAARATGVNAATTVRVTVKEATDFGNITQGAATITVVYLDTVSGPVTNVGYNNVGSSDVYVNNPIKSITQTVALADFTDNADATGYVDLDVQVPTDGWVIGWSAIVSEAFAGDTSAVPSVGYAGALTAFTANTSLSVFTAGTVATFSPVAALGAVGTARTVRVTVTGGSDFGAITGGSMEVTVYYLEVDDEVLAQGRKPFGGTFIDLDHGLKKISGTVTYDQLTDGGAAVGYKDVATLPTDAIVFGWNANVTTAFAGGANPRAEFGDDSTSTLFTAAADGDRDISSTGWIGSVAPVASGMNNYGTATTLRLSVEVDVDFGNVTAGALAYEVYYFTGKD